MQYLTAREGRGEANSNENSNENANGILTRTNETSEFGQNIRTKLSKRVHSSGERGEELRYARNNGKKAANYTDNSASHEAIYSAEDDHDCYGRREENE